MASSRTKINPQAVKAGSKLSFFEKYLTLWVVLCILAGVTLGRTFPGLAEALDAMSIYNVSIPIAICQSLP
ncbi:Arsenical-resistance protein ACR3 [Richelia intracellularis]|nr:Arsenical-resistance protein ACR3 [Richelia intracellularis]